MTNETRASLFCAAMLIPAALSAATSDAGCSARSGSGSVTLVELFTAEGCDSCPPADRWLSALGQQSGSLHVVPLAFHVDYWDNLGWKDPYAKEMYSQRQRELAARDRSATVYTPQVRLNGRDWAQWRAPAALDGALRTASAQPARAELELAWNTGGGVLRVSLGARLLEDRQDAAAYVAVYENRLTSAVRAGENRGATLRHEFVVRELLGPFTLSGAQKSSLARSVKMRSDWKAADLGVAAFIEDRRSGEVLQALAAPACG